MNLAVDRHGLGFSRCVRSSALKTCQKRVMLQASSDSVELRLPEDLENHSQRIFVFDSFSMTTGYIFHGPWASESWHKGSCCADVAAHAVLLHSVEVYRHRVDRAWGFLGRKVADAAAMALAFRSASVLHGGGPECRQQRPPFRDGLESSTNSSVEADRCGPGSVAAAVPLMSSAKMAHRRADVESLEEVRETRDHGFAMVLGNSG